MTKLQELISACKNSVTVTVNNHRDYYETVQDYISAIVDRNQLDIGEIAPEVMAEMIARDTIVEIQAYPRTGVGFYLVYHYDVELCAERVLQAINDKE